MTALPPYICIAQISIGTVNFIALLLYYGSHENLNRVVGEIDYPVDLVFPLPTTRREYSDTQVATFIKLPGPGIVMPLCSASKLLKRRGQTGTIMMLTHPQASTEKMGTVSFFRPIYEQDRPHVKGNLVQKRNLSQSISSQNALKR